MSLSQDFVDFIVAGGATLLPTTNEWEVIRYKSPKGIGIVYTNSKGKLSPTGVATVDFEAFSRQTPSPNQSRRQSLFRSLAHRDGPECFYCGGAGTTIEHLLARRWGGTNHKANLVLACQPCNQEAGELPVIQKVLLRERKRNV